MEFNKDLRPKVGIGVMVVKDGKVLLGKRKGSHGEGCYAYPGGHLEYMESIEDCAKRECLEEAGIEIDNVKFLRFMNFKSKEGKHYADIAVSADWKDGQPQVLEVNKCEVWEWYDFDALPSPLFEPIYSALESFKTGKTYFDN